MSDQSRGRYHPTPSFDLSVAFSERSIEAVYLKLLESEMLGSRFLPDKRLVVQAAERLTTIRAGGRLMRSALRTIERDGAERGPFDHTASALADLTRVLGARFRSPLTSQLGHYAWRVLFDNAVDRSREPFADVVVGMPGSSKKLFLSRQAKHKVFHATDAHPRDRNSALLAAYPRRQVQAEIYPVGLIERIEDELYLADSIVVPSELVKSQMQAAGVLESKLVTAPFGVDRTLFSPSQTTLGPGSNEKPRLLYVGQISLLKGIPFLIKAVRSLPVDLILVGNVFDRRILADLPDNVQVLGPMHKDRLAAEYARASAFVLPTLTDAFGMVVFEALSLGLPVITTTACGAAEFLDSGHLIVPPGDSSALRDAIISTPILGHVDRLSTASEGFRNLEQQFGRQVDWTSYADALVSTLVDRYTSQNPVRG